MRVWQHPGYPQYVARGLKRMRGSRVKLSPDSPANEGVRTRPNAGNPEAKTKYSQLTTAIYK